MPIHTILGATGATGSSILRALLTTDRPDLVVNVLIRSEDKFKRAFPEIATQKKIRVNCFIGSVTDAKTVKAAVEHATVIYLCVSTNKASKVTVVGRNTAAAVVNALKQIRDEQKSSYIRPVVLINRSITLNKDVWIPMPHMFRSVFRFVISDIYDDLEIAVGLYQHAAGGLLLSYIIIDGPGLQDEPGRTRTGYRLLKSGISSNSISYADFGAAFVEVGERSAEFENTAIAVAATGKVVEYKLQQLGLILRGLRIRLFGF